MNIIYDRAAVFTQVSLVVELQFPNDANVYYAMDASGAQSTFLVKKISEKTPKKILKNKSFH